MPPPIPLGSLMHATAIIVIAFFVFLASQYATRRVRTTGIVLGGWLCVLSLVSLGLDLVAPIVNPNLVPVPNCERLPRRIEPPFMR